MANTEYSNVNNGALFKNEAKEGNQPDYRGSLNCDGVDFWVSAWIKTSKAGGKFMSLSVQAKESAAKGSTKPANATKQVADTDDGDIPF